MDGINTKYSSTVDNINKNAFIYLFIYGSKVQLHEILNLVYKRI